MGSTRPPTETAEETATANCNRHDRPGGDRGERRRHDRHENEVEPCRTETGQAHETTVIKKY